VTVDFYGHDFFRDDCFPDWLVKRRDFLKLCPRFCVDEKDFSNIEIPVEIQVQRALKLKFGDDLDDQTIKSIVKNCKSKELPPNFTLYREGDASDGMYVLIKGTVTISSSESKRQATKVKEICIFGHMEIRAYQETEARSYTVITKTPCLVAKLDHADYKSELGNLRRESILRINEWCGEGHSWLFSQLTKRRQMLLADRVELLIVPENSEVYFEGDVAETMYVIRRGKCIARKQLDLKQANHKFTNDITLAEFNIGDYFGEEICVGLDTRLMRVVADVGGVELFVLEKKLCNDLFPSSLWDSIREQWRGVLQNIEDNYNENLSVIRGKRGFYDFKLKAIGSRYNARTGYSSRYIDNVDTLQKKELTRSSSLTSLYKARMGFNIEDLTRSVRYAKRLEDRLWKANYLQRMREGKPKGDSENEKRVMYIRHRPKSKELTENTQEFMSAIDGVNQAVRVRHRDKSDYDRKNIPRLVSEQTAIRAKLDSADDNEDVSIITENK